MICATVREPLNQQWCQPAGVGKLLGHVTPSITMPYTHLAQYAQREATEKFGKILRFEQRKRRAQSLEMELGLVVPEYTPTNRRTRFTANKLQVERSTWSKT